MPIYEFECNACNCTFERFMKVDEDHKDLICQKCGMGNLKKLVGSCSFHSRERYEERLAGKMASRMHDK